MHDGYWGFERATGSRADSDIIGGGNGAASHDAITSSNGATIDAHNFTFPRGPHPVDCSAVTRAASDKGGATAPPLSF
jgi:hypothetical protein